MTKTSAAAAAAVDVQMDRAAVAARCGFKAANIDTYQRRGSMPPPDGVLGRSPWWWSSTIERWIAERPGVGFNERTHGPRATPKEATTSGKTRSTKRSK